MKRLNFFPFYESYLRSREKTTTLRLNNRASLKGGEEVMIRKHTWVSENTHGCQVYTLDKAS